RDVGQVEQQVGVEQRSQQGGRAVLVDHGLDAVELPVGIAADGDAAAAGAEDDGARRHQPADRLELDDGRRFGRLSDAGSTWTWVSSVTTSRSRSSFCSACWSR